ncbi:hypothetical protein D9M68_791560 [compost metagenome]
MLAIADAQAVDEHHQMAAQTALVVKDVAAQAWLAVKHGLQRRADRARLHILFLAGNMPLDGWSEDDMGHGRTAQLANLSSLVVWKRRPSTAFSFDSTKPSILKIAFNQPIRLCESARHLRSRSTSCSRPSHSPAVTPSPLPRAAESICPASAAAGGACNRRPCLSNWPSGRSGIAAMRVHRMLPRTEPALPV